MSSQALASFSSHDFRQALGMFATGVTVIGTRLPDGQPLALTVSSFNALSLAPPLVLWSLGLQSRKLDAFMACQHYAVNVLSASQADLATGFAAGTLNWDEVPHQAGQTGVPLLEGAVAHFECRNWQQQTLGDHALFVGEVLHVVKHGGSPLVYHGGGFHPDAIKTE